MTPSEFLLYFFSTMAVFSLSLFLYIYHKYSKLGLGKASLTRVKLGNDKASKIRFKYFRLMWIGGPLFVYSMLMVALYVTMNMPTPFVEVEVWSILLLFLMIVFPIVPSLLKFGRDILHYT